MGRKYGTLHQYRGRRKRKRSKPNVSTQVPLESNESAIVAVDPPFNGGDTPESDTSGNAARTSNDDDLQETNAQADESYIIASLEAINSLLGHVKCASCGAGDVKIVKGDRMYGLVAKLTLYCEICEDLATQWSSPRVDGPAKSRAFEVNVLNDLARVKLKKWQRELDSVYDAVGIAHSKKTSKSGSARRKRAAEKLKAGLVSKTP